MPPAGLGQRGGGAIDGVLCRGGAPVRVRDRPLAGGEFRAGAPDRLRRRDLGGAKGDLGLLRRSCGGLGGGESRRGGCELVAERGLLLLELVEPAGRVGPSLAEALLARPELREPLLGELGASADTVGGGPHGRGDRLGVLERHDGGGTCLALGGAVLPRPFEDRLCRRVLIALGLVSRPRRVPGSGRGDRPGRALRLAKLADLRLQRDGALRRACLALERTGA